MYPKAFILCAVFWQIHAHFFGDDVDIHSLAAKVATMEIKMKQMDNKMKRMEKQMELDKTTCSKTLELIESEIKQLKDDNSRTVNNSHVAFLNRGLRQSTRHVAFSAKLSRTVTNLGDYSNIIFDEKVSDVGNDYDISDGTFTAPVSGYYVFTWTVGITQDQNQLTQLVKSGRQVGYSYADGAHDDGAQVTNTVVIQVNEREHVMVKTEARGGNDHKLEIDRANTFSGWLLFETV